MSSSSFYDVVVLGDELAGAVAGALLVRRGLRVLLATSLPDGKGDTAGTISIGPYQVVREPLALVGLESPALKRIVTELNLLQLLRRRLQPNHPPVQLCLPDHRIDAGDDLGRELHREIPAEAPALEAHLARAAELSARLEELTAQEVTLPPDGFWDRRDQKRMEAQLPPDGADPLDGLDPRSPAGLFSRLPPLFAADLVRPGAAAHARLLDLTLRATHTVDGGRDALRALLHDRIRAGAGEVRAVHVRGLQVKRGRVVGVGLGDRDEVVGCGAAICAQPVQGILPLLPEAPPHRLEEAAALPSPLRRYRLHLVAPLDALPDALGPFALSVRDGAAPLEEGNALALHTQTGFGQHAVVTATAITAESGDGLRALRARVQAHLAALLPFLDRHLLAAWSPNDGLPADGNLAEPFVRPAQPMDALWDPPSPRALGISGLPHASGLKQLWLASRQVLPGLGLEGELLTGWICARLVAGTSKRREVDKGALLSG